MQNASIVISSRKMAGAQSVSSAVGDGKPKLLDQLHKVLRTRHYSRRTEQTYCLWVKRFIYFHHVRRTAEMAEPEINSLLTYLAVTDLISKAV